MKHYHKLNVLIPIRDWQEFKKLFPSRSSATILMKGAIKFAIKERKLHINGNKT